MIRYRIYTEKKDNLERLAGNFFEGFNVSEVKGYWKGKAEKSVIIEILAGEAQAVQVKALALLIKELNKQESVLITREETQADFI